MILLSRKIILMLPFLTGSVGQEEDDFGDFNQVMEAEVPNDMTTMDEPTFSDLLDDHWPQGELNCAHGFRKFNSLTQKKTYYIGVHAPSGIEAAYRAYNLTFEEYLNRVVGARWTPPIEFKMKASMDPLKDWVSFYKKICSCYIIPGRYDGNGCSIFLHLIVFLILTLY
jgi:hypothetical protein